MCSSDLMGTGLQLHVGSIVTSSNSELLKEKVESVSLILASKLQVDLEEELEEEKKLTFGLH